MVNGPTRGRSQSFWGPMMSAVVVAASDYDVDRPTPYPLNAVSTSRSLDYL